MHGEKCKKVSEVIVRSIFLSLISIYQAFLSPFFSGQCRFYPSCSHYSREAIESHGLIRGISLTLRRLFRCHPFSKRGFDPVPPSMR